MEDLTVRPCVFANPIEEVIREDAGGLLGESNGEQKFRCRYHGDGEDTHPSGSVNPSKGEYFCHVCNSGADVFDWVQRESNLTFPEALQRLARRAGIDEDESSSAVTGEWVYRDSEGRPISYRPLRGRFDEGPSKGPAVS